MSWSPRPLQLDDLPGLLQVQRACYGDEYVEGAEVFARRIASAANCSLVLECEGVVCAYLAAYRSRAGLGKQAAAGTGHRDRKLRLGIKLSA